MPNYNLRKGSIQAQFHESCAKVQVFGGGFGNGKTTALVIKALRLARMYPGCNGLLARATYPKLNDTLRKEFLAWCPQEWIKRRPSTEDNTAHLMNGSIINFRYISQRGKASADGQTTSNLLSATFDFIGVDQVEDPEITEKDFLDLLGRLRGQTTYRPPSSEVDDPSMPSTGPRWVMLTCNPTHNWVYKKIVQPYILWRDRGIRSPELLVDADTKLPIVELFEGSTYTNAENLPADFIKTQETAYRGQMRSRFLMGEWAAFEGLVYGDFSIERNLVSKHVALGHLADCLTRHVKIRAVEGYDFGNVSPSCYLFGFVDDIGRVTILDGFYAPNFNYMDQAPEIRKIRAKYSSLGLRVTEPIYADPDIFRKRVVAGYRSTGRTIASLFLDMGIRMVPSSNEIQGGLAKVSAYIAGLPHVTDFRTDEENGALLYVCDDLSWFQDEVFSYYWRRNPQGEHIDEPTDNNDHAMDALKYMLARLPDPAKIFIPKSALPPQWLQWHEVEMRH